MSEIITAISPHFTYSELTVTSNKELQEQNRREGVKYLPTLIALATTLLEPIRAIHPDKALIVNSAFRCWALNTVTKGSSKTSQHPLGQAADIHREGQSVSDLFQEVIELFEKNRVPFGQAIHEKANRGYATSEWVHVSLGPDFWDPTRCGTIMKMLAGEDGVAHYEVIKRLPVTEWV